MKALLPIDENTPLLFLTVAAIYKKLWNAEVYISPSPFYHKLLPLATEPQTAVKNLLNFIYRRKDGISAPDGEESEGPGLNSFYYYYLYYSVLMYIMFPEAGENTTSVKTAYSALHSFRGFFPSYNDALFCLVEAIQYAIFKKMLPVYDLTVAALRSSYEQSRGRSKKKVKMGDIFRWAFSSSSLPEELMSLFIFLDHRFIESLGILCEDLAAFTQLSLFELETLPLGSQAALFIKGRKGEFPLSRAELAIEKAGQLYEFVVWGEGKRWYLKSREEIPGQVKEIFGAEEEEGQIKVSSLAKARRVILALTAIKNPLKEERPWRAKALPFPQPEF